MRTPLGTITSYDGPAENTEPPKLLLAVGHPAAVADGCLSFFRTLVNGALSKRGLRPGRKEVRHASLHQ